MAGILKLGTNTQFGRVAGVLFIGERYYMMLKSGVVSLMPANAVESRPTVRAKRPVQQRKGETVRLENCTNCGCKCNFRGSSKDVCLAWKRTASPVA
jgi:hypothetical protein